MSQRFEGSLTLVGHGETLRSEAAVVDGHLDIHVAGHQLGVWDLGEVTIDLRQDDFRLEVDGEVLVLVTEDPHGFQDAVGINGRTQKTRDPKLRRVIERGTHAVAEGLNKVPTNWRIGAVGLAAISGLAVFAPSILATLLTLSGVTLLMAGIVAQVEPMVAARFPVILTPDRALVAGLLALVSGGVLTWM